LRRRRRAARLLVQPRRDRLLPRALLAVAARRAVHVDPQRVAAGAGPPVAAARLLLAERVRTGLRRGAPARPAAAVRRRGDFHRAPVPVSRAERSGRTAPGTGLLPPAAAAGRPPAG